MPGVRDIELMKSLAAEIKVRRAELKISQEELAHRANLGAVFIARVESGRNQPSLSAFVLLAEALGAKPANLLASVMTRYSKERKASKLP